MSSQRSAVDVMLMAYAQLASFLFRINFFLIHVGIYIAADLVGIARYSVYFPTRMILLMTLWSILLLVHGIMTYNTEKTDHSSQGKHRDGIYRTALILAGVNAVFSVMWALATDATSSAAFHIAIMLTFLGVAVSALIIAKRVLYKYWLDSLLKYPERFEELKRKREYATSSPLHLSDDGELVDELTEIDRENIEERSTYKLE